MREDGFDEEKSAVLIVDDNEINRMILCETFKGRDEILEAENGEEALALIRRNPGSISAVLLDIVMPKMDGLALLEILNREGLTETIPVFLITADTSEQNMQRSAYLGVSRGRRASKFRAAVPSRIMMYCPRRSLPRASSRS